ncbi:MAG: hypothetical protein GEV06_19885 [Luteitalea sp.]|nr:hypothetical protein [Luteitalea sp.]
MANPMIPSPADPQTPREQVIAEMLDALRLVDDPESGVESIEPDLVRKALAALSQTPRAVEQLVEQWRKEEEDHKRQASAQAPMGGSLYGRHHAKWEMAKRHADELAAALQAQPGAAQAAPSGEQPFVDTPVLAAKRRAFDAPTQANLDALIAAVRSEPAPPPLAPEPLIAELEREMRTYGNSPHVPRGKVAEWADKLAALSRPSTPANYESEWGGDNDVSRPSTPPDLREWVNEERIRLKNALSVGHTHSFAFGYDSGLTDLAIALTNRLSAALAGQASGGRTPEKAALTKTLAERVAVLAGLVEGWIYVFKRIDAAVRSHDGRDLLDELHPRHHLDIKRRLDGRETWHEGDWLSDLRRAMQQARVLLAGGDNQVALASQVGSTPPAQQED